MRRTLSVILLACLAAFAHAAVTGADVSQGSPVAFFPRPLILFLAPPLFSVWRVCPQVPEECRRFLAHRARIPQVRPFYQLFTISFVFLSTSFAYESCPCVPAALVLLTPMPSTRSRRRTRLAFPMSTSTCEGRCLLPCSVDEFYHFEKELAIVEVVVDVF